MVNPSQLPTRPDPSALELSASNVPLCVTNPTLALKKLGQALIAVHPNGSESFHQHDFEIALDKIGLEIFGVERMPPDLRSKQQYELRHFGNNIPTDPLERVQRDTLLYALGRLGDLQHQSSNFFGAHNRQSELLPQLLKLNCEVCIRTGDTNGVLRMLNDPRMSVRARISGVAHESKLKLLGQARDNDAYPRERQSALYGASWRLCKQMKTLITTGGENGQAVPKDQFKDGIRFLLGQGKAGLEMIYHDQTGGTLTERYSPLGAVTFESMADVYQHSNFYELRDQRPISEFPVDRHTAFAVFEALNVEGSTAMEMETRQQAFRLLTAPLHGISHALTTGGSRFLPDDQKELIQGLQSLRGDLEKLRAEFSFSGPDAEQTVKLRLRQLTEHLEARAEIGDLSPTERTKRAAFDQQVRSTLASAVREDMPEAARMEIVEVTSKIMDEWVEYLENEKSGISPENKKNILNVGEYARERRKQLASAEQREYR